MDNPPPPTPLQNTWEYSQLQPALPVPLVLPHLPPAPNPSDPASRLRAAAALIQVTGKEMDVLVTHQNHHGASGVPSQDRLQAFAESTLSRDTSSVVTSAFGTSQLDKDSIGGAPKHCAPRSTHKKTINVLCLAWYPGEVQEVLKYVCHTLVHEMILNLGWLHNQKAHMTWKATVCESLMLPNTEFNTISLVKFFPNNYKMMPTPMYALSAGAFTCGLECIVTGRTHNSGQALPFTGSDYGILYNVYCEGLIQISQHNTFGPTFISCLEWLSIEGMKMLPNNSNLPRSPKKVMPVFILPTSDVAAYEAGLSPVLTHDTPSSLGEMPFL
ncbi:hypothetical protein EDC04DRAFT_2605343 [Pisolithus marmoratus]|nr:hypothetical protein EDC04DRAFT_2605343 [Pisolithus marmoratus]